MKKAVLGLLIVLISLSVISALDITLTKDSYYPGETLQAEISDAFTQTLIKDNIGIYSGDSVHKSPVESGLIKSGDKYLYYAVLPATPGAYSLKIENAKYYSGASEISETIIKNFTIAATNNSYLSVNPGNIQTSRNFTIIVKAYNSAQTVDAEFSATNQKQTLNVPMNSGKTFYFSISGINSFTKSEIKIGDYTIPVIISPAHGTSNNNEIIEDLDELIRIDVKEINLTVLSGKDYTFEINILNRTNQTIDRIDISPSDSAIKVNPEFIEDFEKSAVIKVTVNAERLSGEGIEISNNKSSIFIPINIKITDNSSKVTESISSDYKTCSELSGKVCDKSKSETCSGQIRFFEEGPCCLAECKAPGSSNSWMWAILILLVLAVAGYYLYKKSKKTPEFNEESIFKKKAEKYKERLNPSVGPEVRKGLSKN